MSKYNNDGSVHTCTSRHVSSPLNVRDLQSATVFSSPCKYPAVSQMFGIDVLQVGLICFEDLDVVLTILQSNHDLEAWDTQSLKLKWREPGSHPEPLAPQVKNLAT